MDSGLMNVSTNWLLPVDDLVQDEVLLRRLSKSLGHNEARGAARYLGRALKEHGVHYLVQTLFVLRTDIENSSHRKDIAQILDALELSMPRIIKNDPNHLITKGEQADSIFIGKYSDVRHLASLEKSAENYKDLEQFISRALYKGKITIMPLSAARMRHMFGASSTDKASNFYDSMMARATGGSGTEEERLKVSKEFDRQNRKKTGPKPARRRKTQRSSSRPTHDRASTHSFSPKRKIETPGLVSIDRFIDDNIGGVEDKKALKNFLKIRNVHVVEQAYALTVSDFKKKLPISLRKAFVRALNLSSKVGDGLGVGSLSDNRSALGVTFSEKAGFDVFPADRKRGIDLVATLLMNKASAVKAPENHIG